MQQVTRRNWGSALGAWCGLILGFGIGSPVGAEPQGQTGAAGEGLTEIVVTSRRVEERLQDTPVAVTAFQAADIEKLNIRTIGDAANFTPNFQSNAGPTGGHDAFFFIRGVGQTDLNPATDPGVGTYIDGVYMGRVMGASMEATDIARIEVLRGPQGTLFGRNTIGGAINITTRDPSKEFGGEIGVTGGSRDLKQVHGSVDLPFSDTAGLTLSANYRDQNGWGHRADGVIFDSNTDTNFRGKFKWDPTDAFSLTLTGDWDNLTGTPQHSVLLGVDPRLYIPGIQSSPCIPLGPGAVPAPCSPFLVPLPVGMAQYAGLQRQNWYTNYSSQTPHKYYGVEGTGLTLEWKLGGAKLKSISSYRKLKQNQSTDYDSTPYSFYEGAFQTKQHQWSEELQLTGDTGRAKWLLGAFYYDEHNDHTNVVSLGGNNGCFPYDPVTTGILEGIFGHPGYYSYPACGAKPYATIGNPAKITNNQAFSLDTKAKALFGQTTIKLTDQLSTTLGVRWTKETKDQDYNFFVDNSYVDITSGQAGVANLLGLPPGIIPTLSSSNPFLPPTVPTAYSKSWSQVTPKAGLEWKPDENFLYYFSYSKGFKSGGFNGRPSPNVNTGQFGAIQPYDPEKIDSYEVGAKTQWFDNRLRANLAAFQSNYKGIQLLVLDKTSGFFNTLNAESRIRGAELEIQARPIPAFQVQAGLGYMKDEYQSIDPIVQAGGIHFGMHLPLTPKFNGSLGAQYTWNVMGPNDSFTLRGDYSYRSQVWFEAANTPLNRQGGYGLFNARATYEFAGGHWSVAAYGLNLANKFYLTNAQDVIGGGLGIAFGSVSPPREWGGEVHYRFGR